MILLKILAITVLLFGWFIVAMWFLRRMHPIREHGVIVFRFVELLVLIGAATDVLYNLTIGTLLFMELPRVWKGEWTLSQRMKRIRREGKGGYRLRIADFVCERLLNPYDPDKHHC